MSKIPVIVVFAPTASGKTALMHDLFSCKGSPFFLKGEIISADSMQVYKHMDIGTAKPTADFCKEIPHHLINLITPDVQFSVAEFLDEVDKDCELINSKGKIPVVCGGTGFYIRSFLYGLPKTPEPDSSVRDMLKKRIKDEGNEKLYQELECIDPLSAAVIHKNDEYRICRALEVYYTTGKTRSSYKCEQRFREKYNPIFIVLEPDRKILFERINKRVDKMISEGLKDEVLSLKKMGYTKDMPGMKAIGYQEWFCDDEDTLIIEKIKHNSCKYAKKQYTYIRNIPENLVHPFSGEKSDIDEIIKIIQKELKIF